MSNYRFPFELGMAMQLAIAIATHVWRDWYRDAGYCPLGSLTPRIHSIRQVRSTAPLFHFQGGVIVRPQMVDVGRWMDTSVRPFNFAGNGWVATSALVKYWPGVIGEGRKVQEEWGPLKLEEIVGEGWGILPADEITGRIVVFYEPKTEKWYLKVDPESTQEGDYQALDFPRFTYLPLVPGNLKEARDRAHRLTQTRLFGPATLVLHADGSTGIWWRAGYGKQVPLKEGDKVIYFDPKDEESRALASEEAKIYPV